MFKIFCSLVLSNLVLLILIYHSRCYEILITLPSSSLLFLLLNKFPITGTVTSPRSFAVCHYLLVFFLIPPITTISPSLTKSLVTIELVLIPGSSDPATSTGESLFT